MTRFAICTILLGLALSAFGAQAQEGGRRGIAYVEAPEMSSGVCTGRDAASAFACAKKACISGGGTKQDCLEIAYCFPARWSVDVFAQSEEGTTGTNSTAAGTARTWRWQPPGPPATSVSARASANAVR